MADAARRSASAGPAPSSASPRYVRASLRLGGLHDPEEREAEHASAVVAAGGRYQVHDPGGSTHLRAATGETPPGEAAHIRTTVTPPVIDPGAEGRIRRVGSEHVPPINAGAEAPVRHIAAEHAPEHGPVRAAAAPRAVDARAGVPTGGAAGDKAATHGAMPLRAAAAPRVVDPGAEGRVRRAAATTAHDPGGVHHLRAAPPGGGMPRPSGDAAANRIEQARAAASRPLPPLVQAKLEHGFGESLAGVRVHTGPTARAAATAIGARAYTEGERITLGHGESEHDVRLMAHEATHVVQNRRLAGMPRRLPGEPAPARRAALAAPQHEVRAEPAAPAAPAAEQGTIRRSWGISDILDKLADLANNIPGYRLFTIVLGVNPINMSAVERSGANILRAAVEFIPFGGLIVKALDQYGVFDKAGAWIDQQIASLAMTGAAIRDALLQFLDSLDWTDIFHPGDVWDRAKRIFTEPIDRLIDFLKALADGVVELIKDAILRPLAELASHTRAWDLLIAVLGKNPITGDPVPQTAETLIGGFMKLIGQEEVWDNLKKANAISRAFAWFKGAMAALLAFASEIPSLFINALKSLSVSDLLDLPGAFGRIAGMFGDFAGRFFSWALNAVWNLLEIIFDVVSPGAMAYVKKTGAALKSILKNPLPFVRNLVAAAKLGLQNFANNIGEHLKQGLIDWLTGSLTGVYIPKALTLIELGKLALSVLGITWAQIRGKIVKALGASGETIMKGLETAFDIVVALATGGIAAAWELIKEKLTGLKDMVVEGIISFVVESIVKKAIPKLIAMFIPGAGFISAIISIYDTVKVFIEKLSKIAAVVSAFINSIVAIAQGQIAGAAHRVENALAGLLSLAISFLAGFLGLGNITSKVMEVIHKVRATVDKALDTAIAWLIGKAKALIAKLFGKKDDKKDDRTDDQKSRDLQSGVSEATALLANPEISSDDVRRQLPKIKSRYRLTALDFVSTKKSEGKETDYIHGAVNPELDGSSIDKDIGDWLVQVGDNIKVPSSTRIEKVVALAKESITYTQSDKKGAPNAKQDRSSFMRDWAAGKITKSGEMSAEELRAELTRLYGAAVADAVMKRGDLSKNMGILDADQAHHIIPAELWGNVTVLRLLIEAGWNPNDAANGEALAAGFHGNHPAYTAYVNRQVMGWIAANGPTPPADLVGPFGGYLSGQLIPHLRGLIAKAKSEVATTGKNLNDYFAGL